MFDAGKAKTDQIAILNHNVFIVWKPEYNLGIPIIDEQHRGVVTIINSLHFGIRNDYIEDMLTAVVDMIYDYTQIHFHVEEDFLKKTKFPEIESHHGLHNELTQKLNKIGRSSILVKDPFRFLDFMKEWWINHICVEDHLYRNYLSSLEGKS